MHLPATLVPSSPVSSSHRALTLVVLRDGRLGEGGATAGGPAGLLLDSNTVTGDPPQ